MVADLQAGSYGWGDATRGNCTRFGVGQRYLAGLFVHMLTISALVDAEKPRHLAPAGSHPAAMPDFFRGGLGVAGYVSTWVPAEIRPVWVRCPNCQRMQSRAQAGGVCA
jgi:hypothetical protein